MSNEQFMKLNDEEITYIACQYMLRNGFDQQDSQITVASLVEASRRGHHGHGIERILQIRDGLVNGTININPIRKLVRSGPSFSIFCGGGGLGPPVANLAMTNAIRMAKSNGVGVAGVLNSGHIGMLAYYTEQAANEGCFAICMSTSSPAAVVVGGNRSLLGTNPIAYSFPGSRGLVSADFSTTTISRSTLLMHRDNNQPLDMGWAVDSTGVSTDDAEKALKGGLQLLGGGVKGTLIGLLVATMAGPLIGGVGNHKVLGTRYMNNSPNKGDIFICFDVDKFTDRAHFLTECEDFFSECERTSEIFYTPGSSSYTKRELNKNLIEISRETLTLMQS